MPAGLKLDGDALAARWAHLESKYQANFYDGQSLDTTARSLDRHSHLALLAPHSVNHYRDRQPKLADRWTGGLTEALGEILNVNVMTVTRKLDSWDDWDSRQDDFGQFLPSIAKKSALVVDMHGMNDSHGADLCIGLGPRPGPTEKRAAVLLQEELRPFTVRINDPFPAVADYTVTSHLQTMALAPCIQLEMSSTVRRPDAADANTARFLEGLARALWSMENELSNDARSM